MTGSFQTFAQNPPIKGGFSLQGVPFAGFKFNLGTIPTLEQKHTSKSIISGSDATTLPEPTETKVLYQLDTPPTWFRSADTSSPSSTFTTSRLEGKPPPVFDLPSRQRGSAATENRKDPFDFERTKKQMAEDEEKRLLAAQLTLLSTETKVQNRHEIAGAPIFTSAVLRRFKDQFTQHGFLAGMSDVLDSAQDSTIFSDPRVFFNIAAPSSAFICGSQGSGKSHTLCCLLENCLMKSDVSTLYKPLAGLIFYYDSFTSDVRGTPCEAAYLASNTKIKVRILCSPTNLRTIKVNSSHFSTQLWLTLRKAYLRSNGCRSRATTNRSERPNDQANDGSDGGQSRQWSHAPLFTRYQSHTTRTAHRTTRIQRVFRLHQIQETSYRVRDDCRSTRSPQPTIGYFGKFHASVAD